MTLRVAFVAGGGAEADAAFAWLESAGDVRARRYGTAQLDAALREAQVVWVHAVSPAEPVPAEELRAFLSQGGGALLSLQAAAVVGPLGLETLPPNDVRDLVWHNAADEWWAEDAQAPTPLPHVRGLATYGPHPLVEGLHNGTYCWSPEEGEPYAWACYSGGAWPSEGRVVGVERAHRVQNPERVVAWEYALGRGRALCLGAFVHFAARDRRLRPQLERLVRNGLAATAAPAAPRAWWPVPGTMAAPSEAPALPEPLEFAGALPAAAEDAIALAGAIERDEPYDLAGRRALLVGGEQRGIRELWVHPHRVVASWAVKADGEFALGSRVEVTPDVVVRTIETSAHRLLETAFVALEHAALLVDYRPARRRRESVGRGPADFEIELVLDLRRAWPFAAGCGGNLAFRSRSDGRVALIESESEDGVAALFLSRAAAVEMDGVSGGSPAVRCRIHAALGSPLFVAVLAGADRADFDRTLRGVRRLGVAGLVRQRSQRAVVLAEARLAVRSDAPSFDRAFGWAKRRLDAFLGDVPGVGRSLLAGYAASQPGSGDGKPGRAWFFGRDACWSGLALLAAGEYSVVRQVIRFLGDRQDVTGKVVHEATTSGQFHYDAADATPLFLMLVARYLAWSGDRDFVAAVWPHVERAYAYCVSGDRDGVAEPPDGGPAPEPDPCGGEHPTLALTALWQAALRHVAAAAGALERPRLAAECWARAARVTAAIESRFYDPARGRYAPAIGDDGSPSWDQSAALTVPLLLGAANPVHAKSFLEALGGPEFSAPWGVRMLPLGHPGFAPGGALTGAVRPLYTGWAALAEYRAGLGEAALRHLEANARLAFARERGAFDEQLHGLEERPAGGCPDRAWSAAMVVLPFVEGLLGVDPDAPAGRMTVAPQLPEAWSRLEVLGLRCGETAYDLRLVRHGSELAAQLRRTLGPGLWITLAPRFATVPARVEVDGEAVRPEVTGWGVGVRCAVSLEAGAEHEVRYVLR